MDERSLARWLRRRKGYAPIIFRRALFRIVPFLATDLIQGNSPEEREQADLLKVFRGLAEIANLDILPDVEPSKTAYPFETYISRHPSFTAGFVARELIEALSSDEPHHILYPSLIARMHEFSANTLVRRRAAHEETRVFWRKVEEDILKLDEEGKNAVLPPLLDSDIANSIEWVSFKKELRAHSVDWSGWLRWLEFQVFGITSGKVSPIHWKEITRQIVLIGENIWVQGPEIVNQHILRIIREILKRYNEFGIEYQVPFAPMFIVNEQGKIELDKPLSAKKNKSPVRLISELKSAASRLRDECIFNTTSGLKNKLVSYLESISRKSASQKMMIVIRGDALRKELTYQRDRDVDSDIPPLPESIMIGLEGVIAKHNLFVNMDTELTKLDRMLLGPEDQTSAIPPSDVSKLVETADRQKILSTAARDLLSEIIEQTDDQDTLSRRSKRASETGKNLFRAGLSFLYRNGFKLASALVAIPPALYGLGKWILANEVTLLGYSRGSPPMQAAAEAIIAWLKTLPLM